MSRFWAVPNNARRPAKSKSREAKPGIAPEQKAPEPESYTNRLLKAKQKVWEERQKEKEKGQGKGDQK